MTSKQFLKEIEQDIVQNTPEDKRKHLIGFKVSNLTQALEVYRLLVRQNRDLQDTVKLLETVLENVE